MILLCPPSTERSRKRHRTNTPIKATPVQQRRTQDHSNEEYELPEVRLPGTPLSKLWTVSTPEGGSPKLTGSGKGSANKETPNARTPATGTGSTEANTKSTPSSSTVKGSSSKNVTTADCGKVSSKKKAKNDPQAKKQPAKATDDHTKKTGKRSHPSNSENDGTTTSEQQLGS